MESLISGYLRWIKCIKFQHADERDVADLSGFYCGDYLFVLLFQLSIFFRYIENEFAFPDPDSENYPCSVFH